MAQIIRHRKGVLESVGEATTRKAEFLIVTGSSGITATNSDAMAFIGLSGNTATPTNKIIYGTSTPDLTGDDYTTDVDGIPYYNTSEEKLYILAKSGNTEVKATANTNGTGIISGSDGIAALGANIVSESAQIVNLTNAAAVGLYSASNQVAADLLADNRNIDLGTGTFDAGTITSDGTLNVSGVSSLGVISGSSLDLTGNANIAGNITLGGNITIGDASDDTIALSGEISSDIIPDGDNTRDLGSASDRFAEVHAAALFGAVSASNGVVSGSAQTLINLNQAAPGVISGSTQLDGTALGTTSDIEATGSFTGSFTGDGSGLTGLATNLVISGSTGDDEVDLLTDALTFAESGSTKVVVTDNQVEIGLTDDVTVQNDLTVTNDLTVSNDATISGDATVTGRVGAANLGTEDGSSNFTGSFTGDGSGLTGLATNLIISGGTGDDEVDLLTDALTFSGTDNEIVTTVTDNEVTISLPDDVTIGNNLTVTGDLTVQGTQTIVNSEVLNISASVQRLNYGGSAVNGGLEVSDATGGGLATGSLLWDGTNDYWIAGAQGSEVKILLADGDGIISESLQIADDISGSLSNFAIGNLGANIVSESAQLASDISASLSNAAIGDLGADIVSSSAQIVNLTNAANVGLVSGSEQVTTGAAASEVLIKHASDETIDGASIYSLPATSTIAINDSSPESAGANGELIINGTTTGFSGILTQDVAGTTVYQQYATTGDNLVNFLADSGYGLFLQADNDTSKAWAIDTDGDFVAQGNLGIYAYDGIFTNDISGSNLKLTGNAVIDGNITLGGNIIIGNEDSDTISFNGEVATDFIPDTDDTRDLGSSSERFAEIHGTNIYGTLNGALNATNNAVSQSTDTATIALSITNGNLSANAIGGIVSQSAQTVAHLLNQATDFGTGRVSGDNFGDVAGTSTFTGSFVGDGSLLTGLSTDLSIADAQGNTNDVDLLNDTLTFNSGSGNNGIEVTVGTDTVSIAGQDATTTAKGVARFDSDDFSVSSGNVSLKSGDGSATFGGVRGANLASDVAGNGLEVSVTDQQLNVLYGSAANQAVQGNTTITVNGTANEIAITGTAAQALGGGASYTIGLPDDVTIATASIQDDLDVGGDLTVQGNLTVEGSMTTIDSTTVNIGDRILELNYGGAAGDAGLLVSDAVGSNTVSGSLLWDASEDKWIGGALGSELELARLNTSPTANTVLKANANGVLVDSVLSDDGTDATFSGDLIVSGLGAGSNGAFLYVDSSDKLVSVDASNAGDVIQWDGSSFVASNELDGGVF